MVSETASSKLASSSTTSNRFGIFFHLARLFSTCVGRPDGKMKRKGAPFPDFGFDVDCSSHPSHNVTGQIQTESHSGYIGILEELLVRCGLGRAPRMRRGTPAIEFVKKNR